MEKGNMRVTSSRIAGIEHRFTEHQPQLGGLHIAFPYAERYKTRKRTREGTRDFLIRKVHIMTFKEILSRFDFAEIVPAFLHLWQTNEPKLSEHVELNKWEKIYQSIQTLKVTPSDKYIRLGWRWENCTPMIDMNCSVYGKSDNQRECPVACYPSWQEILGMEVVIENDVNITPQELAAGLLWEITYFGGTEKLSNENKKRIFHNPDRKK